MANTALRSAGRLVPFLAVVLAASGATLWAAAPQSDDFSSTQSFWKSADIGQQDGGSFSVEGGKLLPVGSGADIWTTTFQFYYVYQEGITGSFDARVKVEKTPFPDAEDGWSGTGMVVTTPDALTWDGDGATIPPWVEVGLSNNNGAEMKWGAGGSSANATQEPGLKPPVWLRLIKLGDKFTSYYSKDGTTWNQIASIHNPYPGFPIPDPYLVGIHVQSHEGSEMGDPILDDFQATALGADPSDTTPPAAITDLAVTATGETTADLTWSSPGGDALVYELRHSPIPIDASNWDRATVVNGVPFPDPTAGAQQTFQVTGLNALDSYYLALRTTDANLNTSAISNVALANTKPRTLQNGVLMERYEGLPNTSIENDLRTAAKFPDSPDFTDYLPTAEAPTDVMDNYGVRLRGYLLPPVTGDYIFGIAGDDNSELWLSTDEDPANIEMIANVLSWTNSREWEKEENQTSAPVRLQAGRRYYFEALMKEGGGGDNLAVRWFLPDGTEEAPIPNNRLAPFIKTAGDFGRLRGIIRDAEGRPIAGAVVTHTVSGETYRMTADANGLYTGLVLGGAGETTAAFLQPWDSNTLKMSITVPGNEVVSQDFNFNLVLPPFIPTERDAALSDDFSGSSLDAKWTSEDIGDTDPGETQVVNGQLVVTANGADIWDGGDHFRFTYQEVEGDFTAVLHILTVPTTDGWSKSGIMARESTDYQSLHSFVAATRDNGLTVQGRINFVGEDTPENISTNGGTFVQNTGYWVKLIRKGQTFTGFKSADGVETTFIRTDVHPNLTASRLLLGHAVTSHSVGNLGETIVDDFIVMRGAQEPTAGTAPPPGVKGDVDGNGQLAILDVVTALRIVAGLAEATPANLAGGDLNANGRIEITEVVQILRAVAGLAPL